MKISSAIQDVDSTLDCLLYDVVIPIATLATLASLAINVDIVSPIVSTAQSEVQDEDYNTNDSKNG